MCNNVVKNTRAAPNVFERMTIKHLYINFFRSIPFINFTLTFLYAPNLAIIKMREKIQQLQETIDSNEGQFYNPVSLNVVLFV